MDDDALAHAWESFATALREVPARRMERWLCRPSSLEQISAHVAQLNDSAAFNKAMMMRGSPASAYAGNGGLLGFRLF